MNVHDIPDSGDDAPADLDRLDDRLGLRGAVVVVTGAAGGIGRAIAEASLQSGALDCGSRP